MKIIPVESGPVATNGYLLYDENSLEGVLVDAPPEISSKIINHINEKQIRLKAILLTHSHWDHTADAAAIKKLTNSLLYVHRADEYRLLDQNGNSIFKLPFKIENVKPDSYLNDYDTITFGINTLEVVHTPGHTEGSVCFVEHNEKVVFSGDTLFQNSIGRTDLPGGSTKLILNSIMNRLLILPDSFTVYPGHGIATTIGKEKRMNPFVSGLLNKA
jgi:glyoxylase-like metal-dependent hydrolase (beta-lactamase superfamily II)